MKYLYILFPIFDHLYIFQLLEYKSMEFLLWFIKYPFKRNLQRKNHLILTQKAKILLFLSSLLMFICAIWFNYFLFRGFDFPIIILLILYLQLFSPLFLITAQILLIPLESYTKQKQINAAKRKLTHLKNLKIVAITGSYAKTSTKNMLYTLLWKKFRVIKTPRSYNNPLSIAETVLSDLKDNTDIFIVEVGAYKMGEIKKVVSWLKPDIGIVTGIAPQHLERFGSLENIAKAKFELVEGLSKNKVAILNGGNEFLRKFAKKAKFKVVFFGKPNSQINLPLDGEHHLQNFSAAALAALELGLIPKEIQERSKYLLSTPHRLEIKKQGSLIIIDNSYNTNPDSAKVSFKLLKDTLGKQKIIITPGLIELGLESSKINQEFVKEACKVADEIIIVGETNKKDLLKGLKNAKFPQAKTHTVQALKDGMNLLTQIAKKDAVVLIENDLNDQYF